jgi:D-glycero-D-manno-heptose 1,7-bisphosphate phosphatase
MNRRAVFLDRDGVLVETCVRDNRAYAVLSLDEFRLCPEAGPQVARLRAAGLLPIVFTNQPEVARGALHSATLDRMHERLRAGVSIADVFVCPHDAAADCACRKPRPGMLHAAAAKWGLDLGASFVIGDRWRDIEAGRVTGCYTVLLDRPYSDCASADARVVGLADAVDAVLARAGSYHGLHRPLSR